MSTCFYAFRTRVCARELFTFDSLIYSSTHDPYEVEVGQFVPKAKVIPSNRAVIVQIAALTHAHLPIRENYCAYRKSKIEFDEDCYVMHNGLTESGLCRVVVRRHVIFTLVDNIL